MKEKIKKKIKNAINIIGYNSAISYVGLLGWLIYKTRKYGVVPIASKPIIGILEVIGAGCIIVFLLCKVFKETGNKFKQRS